MINLTKKKNALSGSETIAEGGRLDRFGAAASLACAVHCAAMPMLVGLLPIVVGLSLCVGIWSLLLSYARKHRHWRPLLIFAFGASLIIAVRLLAEEGSRLEAPAMVAGALLIACAHMVNRRLRRRCATCHPAGE
jgi:uncharacterized membrane protein YfcA